jgi:tripartite-type tricarboxylate transporter receptor subunit TctC
MISRRTLLSKATASAALAAFGTRATAQDAKPIRMIVGYPAGGVIDNLGRLIADELRRSYPAGVIVENKVGAGGRIAVDLVKRVDDDGHTVLLAPCFVFTIFPHVYRNPGYDALADFKPVAGVASYDYTIAVGPAVPASVKTLPDFIQWVRENPARAQYGVPAPGSPFQFIGTLLARETGIPFTVVPYKGGPPMVQDLLGGQIPAAVEVVANLIQYHKAGRVRILAVAGAHRSPFLPAVPAVGEYKLGSLAASEMIGFYVPANVRPARIQKLYEEVSTAAARAKEKFAAIQLNPESLDTAELDAFTRRDFDRWKGVVQASGFKAE